MVNIIWSWFDRMAGLKKNVIDKLLDHGKVYEVGGSVRDSLIGSHVVKKDSDYLVTGIPIDDLVTLLKSFGKVDLVGKSFGVIKFTARDNGSRESCEIDIALPRSEFSTGIAHRDFRVDFDHSLPIEADLRRRDFTINAIARDLATGELVDPLNGRADLEKRLLRMIAPASFTDDPLRILRGIQFTARFGLTVEPETFDAMRDNVELMATVTAERIGEELSKLLIKSEKPSIGFRLMREIGLLNVILPELENTVSVTQPGGYHAYDVFEHLLHTVDAAAPTLCLRWAALLHDITKPQTKREVDGGATFYGHEVSSAEQAGNILRRFRYSNELIDETGILIKQHMFTEPLTDKGLRRLIRRTGIDLIFDLLDLRRADVAGQGMGNSTDDVDELEKRIRDELERKPPFSVTDLAIDGNDIKKLFDIPESPLVGKILLYLLDLALDDPEKNNKEILIEAVKEYLHSEEIR